jgi:hypothetical protein
MVPFYIYEEFSIYLLSVQMHKKLKQQYELNLPHFIKMEQSLMEVLFIFEVMWISLLQIVSFDGCYSDYDSGGSIGLYF